MSNSAVEALLQDKTILLVDDEFSNIFAMKMALKPTGVNIIEARSGLEAIEKLHEHADEINIVLMDIMMPEKDGYTTIREIRAEDRYSDTCIVALTAKAMVGDRELCLEAGANDYLSKPVDLNDLMDLLGRWLA